MPEGSPHDTIKPPTAISASSTSSQSASGCANLSTPPRPMSESGNLTRHQIDGERHRLRFRTLKRRKLIYRFVPIPEPLCAMLLALPCDPDGRLWRMHRVSAWRLVREVMMPIQICGPMHAPVACATGSASTPRNANPAQRHPALDGPCLAEHDRDLPRRGRGGGAATSGKEW